MHFVVLFEFQGTEAREDFSYAVEYPLPEAICTYYQAGVLILCQQDWASASLLTDG
jgi:hypothetical protein